MSSKTPKSTWCLLASLYTTQYLGLGFLVVALVVILREQGATLGQVSLIYMTGMVWPFKFLWAPIVDRFSIARMGHYRTWLIAMQGGLALAFLGFGQFDPLNDFAVIYSLCLLVALFSATQDIAIDGLACRLLSADERGLGNGIQIAGGLLGNMLGGGAVLLAYPHIGWHGSVVILAVGTCLPLTLLAGFREPDWETPRATGHALIRCVKAFWQQPNGRRWLMLLLVYPISSSLAYALITPILVDAGWRMERIGFSVNIVGSSLGVLAALSTGWLLTRLGRRKVLIGAALVQIPGIAIIALPVFDYTGEMVATLSVGLFFLLYNPAATVLATVMMDHASFERPATDYTFQYSLNMFVAMGMMSAGAALADIFGYAGVLALAVLAAIIAALLSFRYRPMVGALSCTDAVSFPPPVASVIAEEVR